MAQPIKLKGIHRKKLLEELHKRFEQPQTFLQKLRYLRKKYLWLILVEGARYLKRILDFVFSSILLIVFSPIMLLIAAMIKISDGGPVLYCTQRVGKWGGEFTFPKFRTMKPGAHALKDSLKPYSEHPEEVSFKMKDDPRITPLGRFLRKFSLDELPQLWCVMKGEMSLVGPRPSLPEEVALYTLEQRKRLDALPGLTCFWQVGGRSEIPFRRQVELDIAYIESQSIWLDLRLILQTIPAVMFGKGAY